MSGDTQVFTHPHGFQSCGEQTGGVCVGGAPGSLSFASGGPGHGRGGGGGGKLRLEAQPHRGVQSWCVMRSHVHHRTSKPGRETEQAEGQAACTGAPRPGAGQGELPDKALGPSGPQFAHGKNGISLPGSATLALTGMGCNVPEARDPAPISGGLLVPQGALASPGKQGLALCSQPCPACFSPQPRREHTSSSSPALYF